MSIEMTQELKDVLALGSGEAQRPDLEYIEPEHLLVALFKAKDCLGWKALQNLASKKWGDLLMRARTMVNHYSIKQMTYRGLPKYSPASLKVLELAEKKAGEHGFTAVNSVHLLLALFILRGGVVAKIFLDFDIEPNNLDNEALEILRRALQDEKAEKKKD